ncbi:MAG: transglutaminase domain-containing protein, partial [Nitrospirae bacterium]|nr:transglutaminase domain-containing protein [Nitrospirota bacterium]
MVFNLKSFLPKHREESRNIFYSIFFIFYLLWTVFITASANAEALGPGWHMVTGKPVSPEEAEADYNAQQAKPSERSAAKTQSADAQYTITAAAASAATATDEIKELARGLQYDPKLIYDYVHNHIDYVPYFGSRKGATLTYFDGSGNDFDQASLMIALLRESANYNSSIGAVQYIYGYMTIPGADLANWFGVDQNSTVIGNVLTSGGIPVATLYSDGKAKFRRVWVKANIGGIDYLFDPAFKSYTYTSKIDIGSAAVYNQTGFLISALSGASIGPDYVQNLNEGNISGMLNQYSSNLINVLKTQYPNSDMQDIIGGRSIV